MVPRDYTTVFTVPAIRVAFVLSLVLHAALLWGWVLRPIEPIADRIGPEKESGPLAVRLAAPPSPPTPPAPALPESPPQPQATKRSAPPPAAPRPPPTPKVLAKEAPAPAIAAAPPEPPAVAPAPAPLDLDFSAALEARRRARGGASEERAPAEDERARHNRIVAENLGLNRVPTYGREPTGGGIFRLERVGYTDAEFVFFGWNKDIRRRSHQLIAVERGANPSIEIAIVRRMIAIVREHESGDFVWRSTRLGRDVTLSARAADTAGLEDFLMREFFPERRPG